MSKQTPAELLNSFLEEHKLQLTIDPVFSLNNLGILAFDYKRSTVNVDFIKEENAPTTN